MPLELLLPLQQTPPLTEADVKAAATAAVVGRPFKLDCWLNRLLVGPASAAVRSCRRPSVGKGTLAQGDPWQFRPLPAAAGPAHHVGASAVLEKPGLQPPLSPPCVARRCLSCRSGLTRA